MIPSYILIKINKNKGGKLSDCSIGSMDTVEYLNTERKTTPRVMSDHISLKDFKSSESPSSSSQNLCSNTNKLRMIVYELVTSEQYYHNDLLVAFRAFYLPLREKQIISLRDIEEIFLNWSDLVSSSEKTIDEIKNLMNYGYNTYHNISVAESLKNAIYHMTPYIEYCSRNKFSMRKYSDMKSANPLLDSFEKECQLKYNISQALTLETFLIKPMQRLTKLRLLYEEIKNVFFRESPEYLALTEVLEEINKVCSQANESARRYENSILSGWLEKKISHSHDKTKFKCIQGPTKDNGDRRLMFHGILKLINKNKDVYCFLFNDVFIVCLAPDDLFGQDLVFTNCPDNCLTIYKDYLEVKEIFVQKSINDKLGKNVFNISSKKMKFTFEAKNERQMNQWIQEIALATRENLLRRMSVDAGTSDVIVV